MSSYRRAHKARKSAAHRKAAAGALHIELGFILNDLLNNCERISDHCSNIAVCVTEIDRGEFDTHEYLNAIKTGNDERFKADFAMYAKKYELKYSK